MPRQNRRRIETPRVGASGSVQRQESWQGRDFVVRSVRGASATKDYRCPGCDQLISPGVAHVVTWPADDLDADARRHWHPACWSARERRAPGVQRSRSAPRY